MIRFAKVGLLTAFALLLTGMGSSFAIASTMSINYTADNIVNSLSVIQGSTTTSVALGANYDNFGLDDSATITGINSSKAFDVVFNVSNSGTNSFDNPAGLLAQINYNGYTFDSGVNTSLVTWQYSVDGSTWSSITTYGTNGGKTGLGAIWTNGNGGKSISGIDTSAEWIWSAGNFTSSGANQLYLRAQIDPVPEAGTVFLFGAGLLGFGFFRLRKRTGC
ncbi:MAG: PEP-CTERM sorting domain-containing protein [Syntrophobacteraceae bacterium]